jgi:hypothetical protein
MTKILGFAVKKSEKVENSFVDNNDFIILFSVWHINKIGLLLNRKYSFLNKLKLLNIMSKKLTQKEKKNKINKNFNNINRTRIVEFTNFQLLSTHPLYYSLTRAHQVSFN